ncbi:MAG: biotin/lipoyl-containing protein [Pseudomonadota bacterium]
MQYHLKIGTRNYTVEVGGINAGSAQVSVDSIVYDVEIKTGDSPASLPGAVVRRAVPSRPAAPPVPSSRPVRKPAAPSATARPEPAGSRTDTASEPGSVLAPIPGLILEIKVAVGDAVAVGQIVATMEAMKMENNLTSRASGKVTKILAQKGSEVATGDVIMTIG